MEEVIIIGGGVAGLSCLNALVDKGFSPLLLEGSTIGAPKMCGEFLAPNAVKQLQQWGVGPIVPISQANFHVGHQQLDIRLENAAGAISRSEVERQLAARALSLGGRIRENSFIERTTPATTSTPYRFHLASGEMIEAKTAFFATGKYGNDQQQTMKMLYHGIKLHFHHAEQSNCLQMYSLKHAYLGIVAVSDTMSNCACLIKRDALHQQPPGDYFSDLVNSHPKLKQQFLNVDINNAALLSGGAPAFYRKQPPAWPQSYWIGDAFASLYPAIGSGFAHSIESAIQAVHYFIKMQPEMYRKTYAKTIQPKLVLGKLFNSVLLHPKLGAYSLPLLRHPRIINLILKKLDYI